LLAGHLGIGHEERHLLGWNGPEEPVDLLVEDLAVGDGASPDGPMRAGIEGDRRLPPAADPLEPLHPDHVTTSKDPSPDDPGHAPVDRPRVALVA
jgi:hypothetical protein